MIFLSRKTTLFVVNIPSEKVCQIDVGETTFRIDLTEKAKIIRTSGEKICQIDVSETTFRIDWRLQEFPLDLELEKLHTSRAVQVRATSD